jgi:hypothetical protein
MSAEETIPQLRERIDQQNKQIAGLRKQNGELLTVAAKAAFESAGYNPLHGELFVSKQGDEPVVPTLDAVEAFAEQWQLGKQTPAETSKAADESEPSEGEEQTVDQAAPGSADLDRLSRSGSSSGAGAGGAGSEKMTREEWIQLSRTDKAAAENALRQGKVQLSGSQAVVPGTNPYDS